MVLATGDLHGNFERFKPKYFPEQARMTKQDIMICTGDFGGVWFGDSREEISNPVYPPARRKLAEHGITCSNHTARQLTNQDYDEYDLLIGMDSANLRDMYRICGGDFAGKLHLLMDYTDHSRDVADPWYTEDFESTWRDVLEGCQGLLKELARDKV